jgi:hypothetical protein
MQRSVCSLAFTVIMVGCATVGGIMSEPLDRGVVRYFDAPPGEVRAAAYDAMLGAGLILDEVDEVAAGTWMLVGKRTTREWTAGEVVRVVVEPADESGALVRVLSKRRISINVTAKGDYSDEIFDQIEFRLAADATAG